MTAAHDAVGCPVCGCACDDLRVTTAGGRVVAAARACRLAEPWFLAQAGGQPPEAWVGDTPVTVAEAVAAAADLLRVARRPVVLGLGRSLAGQRTAIALADRLGAVIDPGGDPAHVVAVQQVGESTCTLGEVRQRADLVLFWNCDPDATHPRLRERSIPPTADVVPVRGGWEDLWALRQRVAGLGGPAEWQRLADRMKACRFGVVFFDDSLATGPAPHKPVESLLQLVTDLNRHTRFYALRLTADTSGAEAVLTWQTGYPLGVDFARGYPRHQPGETTARDLLARGEADVCLLLGDGPAPAGVPVIAICPSGAAVPGAAVRITTAVPGVHIAGVARRLDGVTIPLRPLLPTGRPDAGVVLEAIRAALGVSGCS